MCKYAAVTVTEKIMLKGKTNKEDIVLKFYRIMDGICCCFSDENDDGALMLTCCTSELQCI